ncbi:putative transmembrane protein [Rhodoferax ferrireducens T118]|uniref:Putative transmembrane protein n=1 Tax=Albidiferax ferrireducens (strain ATCC BAA-621 / DSM 15236 / T118) TaxID=338969 RepID=Q21U65_ALBFT|nr:EI24 domain-containing protein [Rhodoferax ferrireducens]ABD70688.1 putative transmembrane protein [Rhodoferax ferrireducens T118]
MNLFLDAFWRAVAYCLHPRVIVLSLLPLLLTVALAWGLGYYFWDNTLEWVRGALEASTLVNTVWDWLQSVGAGSLKLALAPLIVIFAVTPILVMLSLLTVALLMTPLLTRLVAARRFPQLERKHGGSLVRSLLWSLGSTGLALIALLVSLPLWLIPPLILVLPPLIWGWLTYRVMAFDALAEHASVEERREIFRRHRGWLLGIGVFCGYLGAAPSMLWASGVLFAAAFVILMPLAIWLYTLIFALSSLWFAHYSLAALQALRAEADPVAAGPTPGATIIDVQALTLPDEPTANANTSL